MFQKTPKQSFEYGTVIVHESIDIAVIELPKPLTFDDYVQPICLPSTSVAAKTMCTVTGWGLSQGTARSH